VRERRSRVGRCGRIANVVHEHHTCKQHPGVGVSLYKILFHFKVLVWESILLVPPLPTCNAFPIAIRLHHHCAIYVPPPTPLCCAMHHTILVMAISCEGQCGRWYALSLRHLRSLLSWGGGSSCSRLWCCSCRVLCGVVLVVCLCVACFSSYARRHTERQYTHTGFALNPRTKHILGCASGDVGLDCAAGLRTSCTSMTPKKKIARQYTNRERPTQRQYTHTQGQPRTRGELKTYWRALASHLQRRYPINTHIHRHMQRYYTYTGFTVNPRTKHILGGRCGRVANVVHKHHTYKEDPRSRVNPRSEHTERDTRRDNTHTQG